MSIQPLNAYEASRWVTRCGAIAAANAGLECRLERSPASESRYLHVRRGAHWYGFRVSCHAPAYNCCHDYEQALLPRGPTLDRLRANAARLVRRIVCGGLVVADPALVERAIHRLGEHLTDGQRWRDRRGGRWRWDAGADRWDPDNGAAARNEASPTHRPHTRLTSRIRCQVRHAQNVAAAWLHESQERSTQATSADAPTADVSITNGPVVRTAIAASAPRGPATRAAGAFRGAAL
ncbi:MAG: hypothetical protein AAFV43_04245 [Planctomycetota bacterium]